MVAHRCDEPRLVVTKALSLDDHVGEMPGQPGAMVRRRFNRHDHAMPGDDLAEALGETADANGNHGDERGRVESSRSGLDTEVPPK